MNAMPALSLVLNLCAEDWARRLLASLEARWNQETVADLHDEVVRLAIDADHAGDALIADAASELCAYLCCFVDGPMQPNPAQRARMVRLARALEAAAQGREAGADARPVLRAIEFDRFDDLG